MIKPHKLVYDAVWRKWFDFRHRGFLKKLFQLGAVKPLGIEIIQTASLRQPTGPAATGPLHIPTTITVR